MYILYGAAHQTCTERDAFANTFHWKVFSHSQCNFDFTSQGKGTAGEDNILSSFTLQMHEH